MAVTPQAQAGSNVPSGQVPAPMTVSDVRSAQASAPAKAVKQGKHIFEFCDCIYKVKTKGGEKTLLHAGSSMPPALAPCSCPLPFAGQFRMLTQPILLPGINGVIHSWEVLAVMGLVKARQCS
eukprot:9601-Rhodomonas_salina.1